MQKLIFKTAQYCDDPDILDRLHIFLRQIEHKKPQVQTQYFKIDWTFFAMVTKSHSKIYSNTTFSDSRYHNPVLFCIGAVWTRRIIKVEATAYPYDLM